MRRVLHHSNLHRFTLSISFCQLPGYCCAHSRNWLCLYLLLSHCSGSASTFPQVFLLSILMLCPQLTLQKVSCLWLGSISFLIGFLWGYTTNLKSWCIVPVFRILQRNFVESMAGYSILCYFLQVIFCFCLSEYIPLNKHWSDKKICFECI